MIRGVVIGMVEYRVERFKGMINKLKFVDSWFWCRYSINAYNGCEHDCIYCDARSRKYHLHQDFEDTIIVKENPGAILDAQLSRGRGMLKDVVSLGGACDAWQPAEARFRNTRNILEVLVKHGFPAFLLTKSARITRDLDIIEEMASKSWATVSFTITTMDDGIARKLEPGATLPSARVAAMREVREAAPGIQHVGATVMPIVPLLECADDDLEAIVKATKDAGGDFILFAPGVSMRDDQASYFLEKFEANWPDVYHEFIKCHLNDREFHARWARSINTTMQGLCKKHGLSIRIPRWIPGDYRKVNYTVAEYLLNKAYALQINGEPYKHYLWPGLHLQNLKESVNDVYTRGDIASIQGFTPRVIAEVKPFLKKTTRLDDFA